MFPSSLYCMVLQCKVSDVKRRRGPLSPYRALWKQCHCYADSSSCYFAACENEKSNVFHCRIGFKEGREGKRLHSWLSQYVATELPTTSNVNAMSLGRFIQHRSLDDCKTSARHGRQSWGACRQHSPSGPQRGLLLKRQKDAHEGRGRVTI